jgi:PTH1 family peptidyl-tRNA hydrolase
MEQISVVCGLGNPGARYRSTRHNLGFLTLDLLSRRHALSWRRAGGPSQEARWRAAGRTIVLLKPLTYMNESGAAVSRVAGLSPAGLLVVSDDLNLPLGRLRFRMGGGSGGHNGLASIIDRLGTEAFPRLRLGIGGAPGGIDWADFVLTDFPAEERETADALVEAAADAVELAVRRGLHAAMQRYNGGGGAGDGGSAGAA